MQAKHICRNVYSSILLNNPTLGITQMSFNNGRIINWGVFITVECIIIVNLNQLLIHISTWMNFKKVMMSERGWTDLREYVLPVSMM